MITTIINDCRDSNAAGRQASRAAALLKCPVNFIGVSSDIEAAGNLIDTLDALGDEKGVVLVNVAPRNGKAKKWENGTPFGYFYYKKILVVSSVDGHTLSLVKKLKLVDSIKVMNISQVLKILIKNKYLDKGLESQIVNTQFRSYDFLPRAAKYLIDKKEVVSEQLTLKEVEDIQNCIWWIDNFGNCKTTILPEEIGFNSDKILKTNFGKVKCLARLKDVDDKKIALVVGSSGIEDKRFIELVCQGCSAAKKINLKSGDKVL